ncbi:hypothetical protein Tco_0097824 [Tanacetum coccineum]
MIGGFEVDGGLDGNFKRGLFVIGDNEEGDNPMGSMVWIGALGEEVVFDFLGRIGMRLGIIGLIMVECGDEDMN